VIGFLEFRAWMSEGWERIVIVTDSTYVARGARGDTPWNARAPLVLSFSQRESVLGVIINRLGLLQEAGVSPRTPNFFRAFSRHSRMTIPLNTAEVVLLYLRRLQSIVPLANVLGQYEKAVKA
jgi:hypothetical protein